MKDDKHSISDTDALGILSAVHEDYFSDLPDNYIGGRHKAEILADAALRDGHDQIARGIMNIHHSMTALKNGQFRDELQYLSESVIGEIAVPAAKGTKYEAAVQTLTSPFKRITDIVDGLREFDHDGLQTKGIDLDASVAVLRKAKVHHFPSEMSMVEKLGHWHQEQHGGAVKR
jgi:hypothetical protein